VSFALVNRDLDLTGRPLAHAAATSFIGRFDSLLFGASRAEP
jgi:hypothetical protein